MTEELELRAGLLKDLVRHFIQTGAQAEREERWEDAEAIYRDWMAKLPMDPRARYSLSLLLLSDGRYEEGWKLYAARLEIPELRL